MNKRLTIAIDGPAAAGKSTIARRLAEILNYTYVDTGAMYRALTYKCLEQSTDLYNDDDVFHILQSMTIELIPDQSGQKVLVNGEDITNIIRTQEVSRKVSLVAKIPAVRKEMVIRQRALANEGGIVMDGRDIGTNVLPNADVKIFLTASVEERARRRNDENLSKGFPSNLEELEREIALRDKMDSERDIDPLRKAEDAIEIDSSTLTISEVVEEILTVVSERK